ncbi:hypothetical protein HHI36_008428, partial [Cryptolaemus montrouzieri]
EDIRYNRIKTVCRGAFNVITRIEKATETGSEYIGIRELENEEPNDITIRF